MDRWMDRDGLDPSTIYLPTYLSIDSYRYTYIDTETGSVCFSPNNNTSPLLESLEEKSGKQLVFVFGLVKVNEL